MDRIIKNIRGSLGKHIGNAVERIVWHAEHHDKITFTEEGIWNIARAIKAVEMDSFDAGFKRGLKENDIEEEYLDGDE